MPKHIKIFQIDAFTSEPFKGNPAAVVFDNALSEDQMKNIAAEMNLSETAFLSDSDLADFNLRWFTPKSEVKLCGHATIASLHYLYENNILKENSTVTFNTKSGIIEAGRNNSFYWMKLPIVNFSIVKNSLTELYSALRLNSEQINNDSYIGSNGYLFICVDNLKTLFNLKPDFNRISEILLSQNNFSDIVIYTLQTIESDSVAHIRFFAPNEGIFEDPATGSAAGPLLLLLRKQNLIKNFSDDKIYIIEQGDVLNRHGRIGVSFNSKENILKIFSKAVTTLKGRIII
ncbi:MAG: PhzF family phenazine biosynthesis protein [Ignavibacterium sp.]|uniref:PhzF family phenazine biosynthesis protein n=1 Tax=Ignavibacterium sp. TaxID=2651167 RepID=UPI00404A584D